MNRVLARLASVSSRAANDHVAKAFASLRELLLANRQRSLLSQQLVREARDHLAGVLEHRQSIVGVIGKYSLEQNTTAGASGVGKRGGGGGGGGRGGGRRER